MIIDSRWLSGPGIGLRRCPNPVNHSGVFWTVKSELFIRMIGMFAFRVGLCGDVRDANPGQ